MCLFPKWYCICQFPKGYECMSSSSSSSPSPPRVVSDDLCLFLKLLLWYSLPFDLSLFGTTIFLLHFLRTLIGQLQKTWPLNTTTKTNGRNLFSSPLWNREHHQSSKVLPFLGFQPFIFRGCIQIFLTPSWSLYIFLKVQWYISDIYCQLADYMELLPPFMGTNKSTKKNPSSGPSWKLSTLRDSLLGCCLHRGFPTIPREGLARRWEDLRTPIFSPEKKNIRTNRYMGKSTLKIDR